MKKFLVVLMVAISLFSCDNDKEETNPNDYLPGGKENPESLSVIIENTITTNYLSTRLYDSAAEEEKQLDDSIPTKNGNRWVKMRYWYGGKTNVEVTANYFYNYTYGWINIFAGTVKKAG